MQTSNGINLLGATSTGTTTWQGLWNPMIFKEVNEVGETIEIIYTQTSQYSRTGGLSPYHDERAVKIIYSCVDGKWNKSEPIYGTIIPATDEDYDFD